MTVVNAPLAAAALFGIACSLTGCWMSHERADHAAGADGGVDARDARPDPGAFDAGFDDAGAPHPRPRECTDVDVVLADEVYGLVRAREGVTTKLVTGSFTPRTGPMPVQVSGVAFGAGGAPSLVPQLSLPDSVGAQPAAASMRGDTVALALDYGERPDELLVLDLASDAVVARAMLDETLLEGFVTYAWLALADDHLLTSVGLPAGGSRLRVLRMDEGAPTGVTVVFESMTAWSWGPVSAVAVAETEPIVNEVLERALGRPAIAALSDRFTALWDTDGASVLLIDRSDVAVDGEHVGVLEWSTFYGRPSLAVGARTVVVGATTGEGLLFSISALSGDELLEWRSPSMRFLAGNPNAHVDEENAGIFFVEPALGTSPSHLRYSGRHCADR